MVDGNILTCTGPAPVKGLTELCFLLKYEVCLLTDHFVVVSSKNQPQTKGFGLHDNNQNDDLSLVDLSLVDFIVPWCRPTRSIPQPIKMRVPPPPVDLCVWSVGADSASFRSTLPRKQQSLRKQEMDAILLRQQQLEETNRQLCDRAGQRRSLRELDISQAKYKELQALPDDKLSIPQYVAVSVGRTSAALWFPICRPLLFISTLQTQHSAIDG